MYSVVIITFVPFSKRIAGQIIQRTVFLWIRLNFLPSFSGYQILGFIFGLVFVNNLSFFVRINPKIFSFPVLETVGQFRLAGGF